jgi:hypothetical protein
MFHRANLTPQKGSVMKHVAKVKLATVDGTGIPVVSGP